MVFFFFFASNFSSLGNSFHSPAARGPGGAKIQFSDLFQLSTSILFTLMFSLYLGASILLNNRRLIRGGYEEEEDTEGNGTSKLVVLRLYCFRII